MTWKHDASRAEVHITLLWTTQRVTKHYNIELVVHL